MSRSLPSRAAGLVVVLAAACAGGGSPSHKPAADPAPTVAPAAATADVPATAAAHASVAPHAAPAPVPAPAPAPVASAPRAEGQDFVEDARLLYRVAACGGADTPVPDVLAHGDPRRGERVAKIVARHCKKIVENIGRFRAQYFEKHRAWFDKVVPADAPKTVVYPFGGGDLLSALVAFPDATEITTISLEQSGDPRRLRDLDPAALERSLGALRVEIGGLLAVGSNTSVNLSNQQKNELPGQVSSFLIALVAAGYEPVAMRYVQLADDGTIRYLDRAAIDALDAQGRASRTSGRSLKHDWESPNFSAAFAHVEIQYRRPGDPTVRVHRHFGWNLGDRYLAEHPQLLRHLEQKGKVTLLTKGASYLLWRGDFSKIRTYMLDHLAWMLSDSTGIPPVFAKRRGLVQETYGSYTGAFLEGAQGGATDQAFVELWAKQPKRRLPFRFGYVDKDKHAHLIVTRPKSR